MFPLLLILFLGLRPGLGPSHARGLTLNVHSSVGPSLAKGCPPTPIIVSHTTVFCPFIHYSIFYLFIYFSWGVTYLSKVHCSGTFLLVQWLRLWAPNAGGKGSIPGQGTRPTCHTVWLKKKYTDQFFVVVFGCATQASNLCLLHWKHRVLTTGH